MQDVEEVVPPPVSAEPPRDPEPEKAAPLPEVTAMDRLAASPASPSGRTNLTRAWVLTFVVLAGAVAIAFTWRDTVIRAWPPSGRILEGTSHATPQPLSTEVKKAE
jgi:hypothetical protein